MAIESWTGLYVDGTAFGQRMLLVGDPGSPWMVGGTLERNQLIAVAISLLRTPGEA